MRYKRIVLLLFGLLEQLDSRPPLGGVAFPVEIRVSA